MSDIPEIVNGLFRREAGRLVSVLTRYLGTGRMDLAEDALQDAFHKALNNWPFHGVPDNPSGWLMRAAQNRAIDQLRNEAACDKTVSEVGRDLQASATQSWDLELLSEPDIQDDQLRMMFLCCHPELGVQSQIALTLKTLCGFSVVEIALGLRITSAAVAQRITRAKRTLKSVEAPFDLPTASALTPRLASVLHVLYLLFSEGYCPHTGDSVVHASLCDDAIYLADLLVSHPIGDLPQVHALVALMMLQASRLDARADSAGSLLLLEEQDRRLWDAERLAAGFMHLRLAQRGFELTPYHIEAGIAATHAAAKSYSDTDWDTICRLYGMLAEITGSPIVALNSAAAIAMRDGPGAGMCALEPLRGVPELQDYYLLHAVSGDLRSKLHDFQGAQQDYNRALECPCNEREREFMRKRIERLRPIQAIIQ